MEAAQVAGKHSVVQPRDGLLLSHEKVGDPDTGYDTDEPRGPYAQWSEPVTEGQILRERAHTRELGSSES